MLGAVKTGAKVLPPESGSPHAITLPSDRSAAKANEDAVIDTTLVKF